MCLLATCMSSLGKCLYLGLLPIFFNIELYELFVYFYFNPLLFAPFANILFHSVCWLFIFLIFFLPCAKLFSLIGSHVFIFAFISFALREWSKKILPSFMSENVLLMFYSTSFMISSLIFRSLNNFGFIFVCGMWEWPNYIGIHIAIQIFQHRLLKRLSFLDCIFLPPLLQISWL